jgi:ATP-dependent RNA helicase DeaD
MSESETTPSVSFSDLNLPEPLLKALASVGYENPSPIQAETIPHLLAGRDVLGQAQTGTGKTAAFALPMLASIDLNNRATQVLVLAPTRELAIQVAEAFQKYAVNLPGFHVLPIYGGQAYQPQLSALKRGAHVVVGTPGRVMDHLKRGTLNLGQVRMVALDEADEMLNMGFLEDVEWILQQMPTQRQVALFSATMPSQIKRIAQTYLKDPAEVLIRSKTTTASNIRQRYWMVSGLHKMDALTRLLEVEDFDGMIIFSRTKIMTEELAEKLEARGFAAAPLNGDVPQQLRERTVQRLRDGMIDIIVATDVAARGLDVERISHVVNYDIPLDIESYVHRIGRTGRAGRSGEAILFVAPREKRMLASIERATRQRIEHMIMPSTEDVNNQRIVRFKRRISDFLEAGDLELFRDVVTQYEAEHNIPAIEVAAALAKMAHEASSGKAPLLLRAGPREERPKQSNEKFARDKPAREPRADKPKFDKGTFEKPQFEKPRFDKPKFEQPEAQHAGDAGDFDSDDVAPREHQGERRERAPRNEVRMETYRVAVGHEHQVKPGNIVGAIANEAGIDSRHIGRIEIFDTYSLVDLPEGMPREILRHLKKVWVAGQELRISPQSPPEGKFGTRERTESPRPDSSGERRPRPSLGLSEGEGGGFRARQAAKRRDFAPRERSERPAPRRDQDRSRPFGDRAAPSGFAGRGERSDRPARREGENRAPRFDDRRGPPRREGRADDRRGPSKGGKPFGKPSARRK